MSTDKHGFTRIKTDKNQDNNKLLEAELSYKIRGCFYKVFNQYGPGLKEIVYHKALAEELQNQGLNFVPHPRINIFSQETGKTLGTYIPDFIVENKIIIEIKALNRLTFLEKNQLMSYLRASLYEIAFLVNFGASKLEINRLILTNDRKPFIRVNPFKIRANPCKIRVNPCFTLMELLLVIALITLLATALLILFNPKKQIEKAQDSKRKTEITQLQKVLEDWYNDKNCYPKPEEICYDSPTANNTCHICGNHPNSPKFTPYLSSLPCDPQYPRKNYLYYFDDSACPKSYVIYTSLSNTTDPAIAQINCQNGCGPDDDCHFNYGFSSPNTSPHPCQSNQPTISPTNTPYPTNQSNFYCRNYSSLYILDNQNICNICGNYNQCLQSYPNNQFFIDPNCQTTCIKN